ncbi:MAG TPA: 3'-5' exonuclease, partial [Zeimonas sp.]
LKLAQTVALLSQLDRRDADPDAVRLTTIHAAKGLEFAHVFVVGCEEGLLPHRGDAPSPAASDDEGGDANEAARNARDISHACAQEQRIEEERRLMYVAVTRAQRSLTLTWCRRRKRGREPLAQLPSRFLAEMQLEASPGPSQAVSQEAGKARLASLRAMLERPVPARPGG